MINSNSKKIISFNSISEAVCYWLGYQFKIGRERLIHEASLRYPIADTITAGEIAIDKIQLEKGHPCFEDKVVDIFVCEDDVSPIKIEAISAIFELKLSKTDTGNEFGKENQRVVDDILRLAYFNLSTKKEAYFLICGSYRDFKNYFIGDREKLTFDINKNIQLNERQGISTNATQWKTENSLYKDYLDFEIHQEKEYAGKEYTFKIIDEFEGDSEETKKQKNFGLNSFQKRYISKKDPTTKQDLISYGNELKIKTTCVAITPFESITHRTHACGIWKIEGIN